MTKKNDSTAELFQLPFFSKSRSELLNILREQIFNSSHTTYIVTPNPEQIIQARQDKDFFNSLKAADYRLPDGIGVVWASRFLSGKTKSKPILNRISGSDVVQDLIELAQEHNLPILLIGGREYQQLSSNSRFGVKWIDGYQDVQNPTPEEEQTIATTLAKLRPSLVFLAFGAPWQEKWIMNHRVLLESSGVKIAMVVGGTFDFLLGKVRRAPIWVQQLGLEWLFRLLVEPWRWRRQVRLLQFIGLVLRENWS